MDSEKQTQNTTGNVSGSETDPALEEAGHKEAAGEAQDEHHPWEGELERYPLQSPEEDPSWAVWTVKIWLGFALGSGLFILALIVLGFFYD
jgi:hypothetical protein